MSKYDCWGQRELVAELEKRDRENKFNYEDEKSEDYDMLARENKAMAEFLSKLGYTNEQITDICNSVKLS